MNNFKIDIQLKNINIKNFEDLHELSCPIALYLNEINITENKGKNTTYLEDVPLYLISSLLLAIPELKAGYPHKYIFFNSPFSINFIPRGSTIEITPCWIEELEELNSQSEFYKKATPVNFKDFAAEVINTAQTFFNLLESKLENDELKFLKELKESIIEAQKHV